MTQLAKLAATLSPLAFALASCGNMSTVDSGSAIAASTTAPESSSEPFTIEETGTFARPWAAAFEPGTGNLFITEKEGSIKFFQTANGKLGFVSGVPEVDYGGQGGLGDIAFAPDYATSKAIYLSWAEAGDGDTRGAVVGRGTLVCEDHDSCDIRDLEVIWRQSPKVTGRGHYSHRLEFSPDGRYLYVASGDRQKLTPAQDMSNTVGSIVRLNLDGTAAAGNPFATYDCTCEEIWSYGHRNILGMAHDLEGRLWEVEHGPAGGDELNLVTEGDNYGWPTRSNGDHYNGDDIPDHTADDGFTKPLVHWTPVIAPGDMTLVKGDLFSAWRGDMLIAGLSSQALVHIDLDGEKAREVARYEFDNRIRAVTEGPDGALWLLEDGSEGRLLKLTPAN
ncbi:PQQ-dependent sugar dehydrogenase [Altererythrobacter sp. MF3-039]|uniref:PQQ-dependent sugar dehydrogenase n=1 Tax=Altererythrobacter sp. MF3-039 TaxID=3252901 RepID=UPI00390C43FA